MIIYKITNRINGKLYIGQTTKSLQHRWGQHCRKNSLCGCLKGRHKTAGKLHWEYANV